MSEADTGRGEEVRLERLSQSLQQQRGPLAVGVSHVTNRTFFHSNAASLHTSSCRGAAQAEYILEYMLRKRARAALDDVHDGEVFHFSSGSELSSRTGAVLFSERFSDVGLLVGSEQERIPAHRLLLGLASPVFRVMLLEGEGWQEAGASEVKLPHDEPAVFRRCLEWMYKSSVDLTASEPLLVLEAARRYELKGLQGCCREAAMHFALKATSLVLASNLSNVFTSAFDMGDEELKKMVLPHVSKHVDAVLRSDAFVRTARPAHLCHLLACDELDISESVLYEVVLQWSYFDPAARKGALKDVLQHLRLPLLTKTMLHDTIRKSGYFTDGRILDALACKEAATQERGWLLVPSLPEFAVHKIMDDTRLVFGSVAAAVEHPKLKKKHCEVSVKVGERVVVHAHRAKGIRINGVPMAKCSTAHLKTGATLSFTSKGLLIDGLPTYTLQRPPITDSWKRPRTHKPDDAQYYSDACPDSGDDASSSDSSGSASRRRRQQAARHAILHDSEDNSDDSDDDDPDDNDDDSEESD